MAIVGQWVNPPAKIQRTVSGDVNKVMNVTNPAGSTLSRATYEVILPDSTKTSSNLQGASVIGSNINFALWWKHSENLGVIKVRVIYKKYDNISANTTLLGETDWQEFEVVEEVETKTPDWKITQVHLGEISDENMTLEVDNVPAAVGTPVYADSELKLKAKSGYTIKDASIIYDFGGGVKKFTIASDKLSASLAWTSGEVEQVSFSLTSAVQPVLVYTLESGDIKPSYVVQKNGVTVQGGEKFYVGDVMKVVCAAGWKFQRNYSGVPTVPYMAGGNGGDFTIIPGTETAEWNVAKAPNGVAYTSLRVFTEEIPGGYLWKQYDQDELDAAHVTMTSNGAPVGVGSSLEDGAELVLTATSGWTIFSASFRAGTKVLTFDIAENRKTAKGVVTESFLSGAEYSIIISVVTEQSTPDVNAPFNNVYKVDEAIMRKVNKERWKLVDTGAETVEYVDYGSSIVSLLALPFDIDPDVILQPEPIQLADESLRVLAPKLAVDKLRVNLGSIVVDPVHNNSMDYVGVVALLHLPRVDPINLELQYVVGCELKITYDIDLYSGNATVNIWSSAIEDVVVTKQVDMAFNIPTQGRFNESPENTNVGLTGDNFVTRPFIEMVSTDMILPEGFYTIPVVDEGTLAGYNGFVTVEHVQLDFKAPLSEKQMLANKLSEGVIINA